MPILETEAVQLSNAVRDAMVALRTLVNSNQLTNNALTTTDKSNLVGAVNELKASIDALSYNDLADLPTIPSTVLELSDRTTYDFPTLNTPIVNALAGKSSSDHTHSNAAVNTSIAESPAASATAMGLGTGDNVEFAAITGTTGTFSGDVTCARTIFGVTGKFINESVISTFGMYSDGNRINAKATGIIGFSVNASPSTGADTAFSRLAAGSVAVGDGTVGNSSGSLTLANITASGTIKRGSQTVAVATASSSASAVAAGAGADTYISDEVGGATLAVSDGTVWRRVSDRAAIS